MPAQRSVITRFWFDFSVGLRGKTSVLPKIMAQSGPAWSQEDGVFFSCCCMRNFNKAHIMKRI